MQPQKLDEKGFKAVLSHFRSDFLAAISVSLVALPLGLGVAAASGAPPIAGVVSAIIGGLVATPLRGSHLAINGPAAGLITVVLAAIHSLDDGTGQALNYVLAATCLAGVMQVILGFFKLGRLAEIIPSSVIQGVMVAIGIIIVSTQIHVALGTQPIGETTLELLAEIPSQLKNIHPIITGMSIIGIFILFIIPKLQSRVFNYFPASLWVLVVSVLIAYMFNFFDAHTVQIFGRDYAVGPDKLIIIPDNLWDAIVYPDFSRIGELKFWVAVFSIGIIASIQTLAMAKAVDKLDPYKRKSDLNKDLIGVGMATAISGAIGGLPIITVIVRSTVNINNNAKTKWSNFYHGLLIIAFIFLLSPVIQKIPMAALAAILVYIGFKLASPSTFKKVADMGIEQLIFMVVTIVITLYTNLLWGILGGTLFTLLVHLLLSRLTIQDFFKHTLADDSNLFIDKDGDYTMQIEGVASFLKIPKIAKLMKTVLPGKAVNIDLSRTRLIGLTFMEYLLDFLNSQRDTGGKVVLSGLDSHVSSSLHNRALKISLKSLPKKLTNRQLRLQNLAVEKELVFTSEVEFNNSYLQNFHFFEIRPIERKSNMLRGSYDTVSMGWEIADVTFSEGAAFTAETFNATVMILKLNKTIPVFSMEKEAVFEKLFDRVMAFTGYKDIDFNMYPDFSNKFLIMGNDADEIRVFFTESIIRFFESQQIFHIESNGEALLIFNRVKLARTDETIQLIDYGFELAKLIESK